MNKCQLIKYVLSGRRQQAAHTTHQPAQRVFVHPLGGGMDVFLDIYWCRNHGPPMLYPVVLIEVSARFIEQTHSF